MSADSSIEWTDATWNPVTGCSRVSPGCAHSMSDLFHEEIPDDFVRRVFAVMAASPQHTFQVLTKRPERMRDLVAEMGRNAAVSDHVAPGLFPMPWPLPNVWLGVSIENRRFVHRADVLRATPAAARFISAEPLLGPLLYDGSYMEPGTGAHVECWHDSEVVGLPGDPFTGEGDTRTVHPTPELDLDRIDWLIVGGESGPGARRIDPQWVRDLRDASLHVGTAFFFKQWGGDRPKSNGRELDGRTWDEMPDPRGLPS